MIHLLTLVVSIITATYITYQIVYYYYTFKHVELWILNCVLLWFVVCLFMFSGITVTYLVIDLVLDKLISTI